jgi:drug/metabolite transporter (DMT)-like permease
LSTTAFGIMLALLTGFLSALTSQTYRKQGDDPRDQATFQLVSVWARVIFSFSFILIFSAKTGEKLFLITSTASGISQTFNYIIVLYVIMMGPIAIAWGILWLAAPAIAIAWAIFPGNEPWSVNQFIGLGLFIICLPTLAVSTYKHNKERGNARPVRKIFFPMMMIAMLLGATDGYFNKYSNAYIVDPGSPAIYITIVAFVVALGTTIYHLIVRSRYRYSPIVIKYAVIVAMILTVQIGINAYGLKFLDVAIFFPIVASSAIILSTVLSAYLHEEEPSPATIVGLLMSIGAIVFLALG